jgi:ATP synthase protein I
MDERDPLESLRDLGKGLDRARRERDGGSTARPGGLMQGNQNAIGQGLRIGLELVVAVVVGAGIGWACDRWLGTRPWGMIGFFFLGIAAGLVNVYRALTGMGMAIGYRRGDAPAAKLGFDDEDED